MVEVVSFHCGGGVKGGESCLGVLLELVISAAVVDVVVKGLGMVVFRVSMKS